MTVGIEASFVKVTNVYSVLVANTTLLVIINNVNIIMGFTIFFVTDFLIITHLR